MLLLLLLLLLGIVLWPCLVPDHYVAALTDLLLLFFATVALARLKGQPRLSPLPFVCHSTLNANVKVQRL